MTAKELFNTWCGKSYKWSALSDIEVERWENFSAYFNGFTFELNRRITTLTAENAALRKDKALLELHKGLSEAAMVFAAAYIDFDKRQAIDAANKAGKE